MKYCKQERSDGHNLAIRWQTQRQRSCLNAIDDGKYGGKVKNTVKIFVNYVRQYCILAIV